MLQPDAAFRGQEQFQNAAGDYPAGAQILPTIQVWDNAPVPTQSMPIPAYSNSMVAPAMNPSFTGYAPLAVSSGGASFAPMPTGGYVPSFMPQLAPPSRSVSTASNGPPANFSPAYAAAAPSYSQAAPMYSQGPPDGAYFGGQIQAAPTYSQGPPDGAYSGRQTQAPPQAAMAYSQPGLGPFPVATPAPMYSQRRAGDAYY